MRNFYKFGLFEGKNKISINSFPTLFFNFCVIIISFILLVSGSKVLFSQSQDESENGFIKTYGTLKMSLWRPAFHGRRTGDVTYFEYSFKTNLELNYLIYKSLFLNIGLDYSPYNLNNDSIPHVDYFISPKEIIKYKSVDVSLSDGLLFTLGLKYFSDLDKKTNSLLFLKAGISYLKRSNYIKDTKAVVSVPILGTTRFEDWDVDSLQKIKLEQSSFNFFLGGGIVFLLGENINLEIDVNGHILFRKNETSLWPELSLGLGYMF